MATNSDIGTSKWFLILPPVLVGGGYFYYAHYRKKDHNWKHSLGCAAFYAAIAAIPLAYCLVFEDSGTLPALNITQNDTGNVAAIADGMDSDEVKHLNAMDKEGRKTAIIYIIAVEEDFDKIRRVPDNNILPSRDARYKALSALTNDELKALYCRYCFFVNDTQAGNYGDLSQDANIQKAALSEFGIDLSQLSDIVKLEDVAITKFQNSIKQSYGNSE